jgi:hypothetical protein
VQGTAECPPQITDPFFPSSEAVFDDATARDAPVALLNAPPPLVQGLVRAVLLPRQRLAAGGAASA